MLINDPTNLNILCGTCSRQNIYEIHIKNDHQVLQNDQLQLI